MLFIGSGWEVEGEREGGEEEKKKATVRSVPDGPDNQLI